METKFTKGEWYAGFLDFTSKFETPYIEIQTDKKMIAKILYNKNEKEVSANAKLISAAPELLLELQNAIVTIEKLLSISGLKNDVKSIYKTEIVKHKQAIKKATE